MTDAAPPPAPAVWDAHAHVFVQGHAGAPDAPPPPRGPADLDAYRAIAARLGVTNPVFVQPNAYGLDNGPLVETLAAFGPASSGVAAVTPDTPRAELDRLHAAGVRGARIMDLGGGAVGLAQAPAVARHVAPLGWTLIVQLDGATLPARRETLEAIAAPAVLDHAGKFLDPPGPAHLDALRRLLDRGWAIKLCAPYEWSRAGPPDYDDVAQIVATLAAHRADRFVWGSNWPHLLREPGDRPDDAALMRRVLDWIPAAQRTEALSALPARLFGRASA
jgi:D-galactarolactone isomerase